VIIVVSSPNHRLKRAVKRGWLRRERGGQFALASRWSRLRPAAQPHR
jgi:hypothetical protein